MKKRYKFASMAAALALMVSVSATSASAGPVSVSTAISCDGATIKNAKKFDHYKPFGIREARVYVDQTGATPASSTRVFLRSANGNDTGTQLVSTGGSVTWDPVQYEIYYAMAYRSAPANCSGALPGHGNYTWDATIRYARPS